MGFFGREPTIGNSNLTQSDLDRLLDLDDPYRTDYTYVTSKSYRPDGSDDYENPRMSRLPLSYYRRKWAFEKARKAGILCYTCFCIREFTSEFFENPLSMIYMAFTTVLRFIIRILWFIINGIFPSPEILMSGTRSQQSQISRSQQRHVYGEKEHAQFDDSREWRDCNEFRPSPSLRRSAAFRADLTPPTSMTSKLGRLIADVVTLGFYGGDNAHRRQSTKRQWDSFDGDDYDDQNENHWQRSSPNIRRRVKTSRYEYSEDRGPEFEHQLVHTARRSRGIIESWIYKLFSLVFMAALSPVKTLEFVGEKVAWVFGMSPTYDLRNRSVYKGHSKLLPYSDRIANYLASTATLCVVSAFPLVAKLLFLPLNVFSYIASRVLGLKTSKHPLKRSAGTSAQYDYLPGKVCRFAIDQLYTFISGSVSVFTYLHNIPFQVAESFRERIAYALANIFGPRAAQLIGFEVVRPVSKKAIVNDFDSVAGPTRRQLIKKTYNKSQLLPTRRSVKYCSVFWKWLFPLLVLLFLTNMLSDGNDEESGPLMSTVKLPFKMLKNSFNVTDWTKAFASGLNHVMSSIWYLLSVPLRLLYNLLCYPTKVFGAMIHPRDTAEKMIQLPKHVLLTGNSLYTYFCKGLSFIRSNICGIIRKVFSVPNYIFNRYLNDVPEGFNTVLRSVFKISEFLYHTVRRIFDNICNIVTSVFELARDVGQLLLTLPSYIISKTFKLMPFMSQKTDDVKWNLDSNHRSTDSISREQAEWNLERLRQEKVLLDSKMEQLRRERELEENRFKDIREAIRLVEESPQSQVPDESLLKSVMVNEELLQHKIEKDFQKYVANLKKADDAEWLKRLLDIEKRLVERLNILSTNIENEITRKITHTSQEDVVARSSLSDELSELSVAVADLRNEFDKLRREKESKIAEFAHAIMSHDSKQGDDFNLLKIELNNKIKDDVEKGLSSGLNRFESASREEREAFRSEIMKMVENRIVTLFASHLAERADKTHSKVNTIPGLSESDFMIIRTMITDALDKYDADKTGKVDYAMESSGGSVVSTRCTESYKENSRLESILGVPLWYSSYSPRIVIQHRTLAAGECWAFHGKGYLTIQLSHPIFVTEVSYEHLQSSLHPEGVLKSAPKLLQVYSYKAVNDLDSKFLLGEFEYDITGRALQTFYVQNQPSTTISIIELIVQSNWGADYTCLYRFRVHGRKA